MKVAFVHIDPSYSEMGPFHLGIASLIAYLRQNGHDCQFFHLLGDVDESDYVDFLKNNSPDVVAFSVTTNIFPYIAPLAMTTKRHTGAFIICGGVHPTLSPEETIAIEGIDAICRGEGEETLLELCHALEGGKDISHIPNLWIKEDGKICENPLRPLIDDLDSLPFIDREVFPYENSFDLAFMRRGAFMASRGCPYNCTYCCSPALKQLYGGNRYLRFRSVDNLIEEVEAVALNFPQMDYAVFHDDLLPMKKEWFADFTRHYRRRIKLPFEMNCHPNLMDRDIARMAKEAGCSLVRFGLESGNDHIRRQVLERRVSNQRMIEAFALCDEVGITTLSYNMVGLPFERRPNILETIKLNARVRPKVTHVSIFYPYPGTKSYDICQREGFLSGKSFASYYEDTVLLQRDLSPEQVRCFRRRFQLFVRLYSRCFSLPRFLGRIAEKLIDIGILAATGQRMARALDRRFGQRAKRDAGPCYTLEEGKVKVFGEE